MLEINGLGTPNVQNRKTQSRKDLNKYPDNAFMVKELCHYDDWGSFLRYINQFEIENKREELINNAFNPLIHEMDIISKGQTQLNLY